MFVSHARRAFRVVLRIGFPHRLFTTQTPGQPKVMRGTFRRTRRQATSHDPALPSASESPPRFTTRLPPAVHCQQGARSPPRLLAVALSSAIAHFFATRAAGIASLHWPSAHPSSRPTLPHQSEEGCITLTAAAHGRPRPAESLPTPSQYYTTPVARSSRDTFAIRSRARAHAPHAAIVAHGASWLWLRNAAPPAPATPRLAPRPTHAPAGAPAHNATQPGICHVTRHGTGHHRRPPDARDATTEANEQFTRHRRTHPITPQTRYNTRTFREHTFTNGTVFTTPRPTAMPGNSGIVPAQHRSASYRQLQIQIQHHR